MVSVLLSHTNWTIVGTRLVPLNSKTGLPFRKDFFHEKDSY